MLGRRYLWRSAVSFFARSGVRSCSALRDDGGEFGSRTLGKCELSWRRGRRLGRNAENIPSSAIFG